MGHLIGHLVPTAHRQPFVQTPNGQVVTFQRRLASVVCAAGRLGCGVAEVVGAAARGVAEAVVVVGVV